MKTGLRFNMRIHVKSFEGLLDYSINYIVY